MFQSHFAFYLLNNFHYDENRKGWSYEQGQSPFCKVCVVAKVGRTVTDGPVDPVAKSFNTVISLAGILTSSNCAVYCKLKVNFAKKIKL